MTSSEYSITLRMLNETQIMVTLMFEGKSQFTGVLTEIEEKEGEK